MRYLRNRPDRSEDLRAIVISSAVAASVGIVTFYFTRLLLAREPLGMEVDGRSGEPQQGDT